MGKDKYVLLLVFIVYACQIVAQIKTDTIKVGNDSIFINYPQKSKVRLTCYEEGFFKSIYCIEDEVLIELHYGAMVNLPLIDRSNRFITTEYILASDFKQTRGFYYTNEEKKYFREDNNYKYGFNIFYKDVPEDKLLLYESCLNSLKFKVGKNIQHKP